MDDRQQAVFKRQLHAVMAGLTISQSDPKQRAFVGHSVRQLLDQTKVKTWVDVKRGLNGPSYDKVLAALQDSAKTMKAQNEPLGVRAMEAIAVALIARHQTDEALRPVVNMLDEYIEKCAAAAKGPGKRARATARPSAS
jgi:hypothetical protein